MRARRWLLALALVAAASPPARGADDVLDLLAVELIGIVPEDENVIISSNRGAPVASDPKSKAGQAFRNIAKRLKGETVPFLDLESTGSLWERIQRLAGRK